MDRVTDIATEDYVIQFNVQVAKGQAVDLGVLEQIHSLFRVLVVGKRVEVRPGEPMTRWESHRVAGHIPSLEFESPSPTVSLVVGPTA